MRHDTIDISKSKQKGRLVRNTKLIELIVDFYWYVIFIGAFPLISGSYLSDQLAEKENIIGASVIFGLVLVLSGLLFYSIINLNRLKRIRGTLIDRNRQAIQDMTEKLGWTLEVHNQQVSVISPPWSWLSTNWGREVVIIYDQQDVLINSTSYGRHGIKSPFHWFGNRKLEMIVKNNFEIEIKTTG